MSLLNSPTPLNLSALYDAGLAHLLPCGVSLAPRAAITMTSGHAGPCTAEPSTAWADVLPTTSDPAITGNATSAPANRRLIPCILCSPYMWSGATWGSVRLGHRFCESPGSLAIPAPDRRAMSHRQHRHHTRRKRSNGRFPQHHPNGLIQWCHSDI